MTGAEWSTITLYLERRPGTADPLRLRVRPVRYCDDSPAVPLPFLVDDLELEYLGRVEPSLPQLAPLACPLGSATA